MHKKLSTNEATTLLMEDEYAHWSEDGAKALIEYLEYLEDSLDMPLELDRVAIRVEFSEYGSILEAAKHYGFIVDDFISSDDEDTIITDALKYLEERSTIIQFEGGVIIKEY